jgi:uncharacterized protein YegL
MLRANNSDGSLPLTVRGYYDSGPLPEEGLLLTDGLGCLLHLFNPPSLQDAPIAKAIVFVIDVSGSMSGQKLQDTKAAFAAMMLMLTKDDVIAVHTFASKATEAVFEPTLATAPSIREASEWVQKLVVLGGTNLQGAYLDGIARVAAMTTRMPSDRRLLPVVLLMTDGQPSEGETDRVQIARSIKSANSQVGTKIFALAFGLGADLPLLLGIAIQNGGVAVPIHEGYGDSAKQMENFVNSELSRVILSDVRVSFEGFDFATITQSSFPVLARGSEISVRAELKGLAARRAPLGVLRAVTSGHSNKSLAQWVAEIDLSAVRDTLGVGECGRGLAHQRITELLEFRDAAVSMGAGLADEARLSSLLGWNATLNQSQSLQDAVQAEALQLALAAGLVWPGLTALVTLPNARCPTSRTGEGAVCSDAHSASSAQLAGQPQPQTPPGRGGPMPMYYGSGKSSASSFKFPSPSFGMLAHAGVFLCLGFQVLKYELWHGMLRY